LDHLRTTGAPSSGRLASPGEHHAVITSGYVEGAVFRSIENGTVRKWGMQQ